MSIRSISVRVVVTLALAVVAAGFVCAQVLDMKRFDREYSSLSTAQLRNLGGDCISRLEPDSAIAFFTLASARYDESMSAGDARECAASVINIGYVWLFMHNNAEQAYPWIVRGIEMCEAHGLDELLPVAYNYQAKIQVSYGDKDKAMTLYRKAFDGAVRSGEQWSVIMMYTDLLACAWQYDALASIQPDMGRFEQFKLQKGPLSELSRSMHLGMKSLLKGEYPAAERYFRQAEQQNDAVSGKERGTVQNLMFLADAMWRGGRRENAVTQMRAAASLMERYDCPDLSAPINGHLQQYYTAMGKKDSATYFQMRDLMIRDSVFNSGRYGRIRDMETSRIINRYDQDLKAVAAERDRERLTVLFVGGIALIVVIAAVVIVSKNRRLSRANRELYLRNMEILERPVIQPTAPKSVPAPDAPTPTGTHEPAQESTNDSDSRLADLMDRVHSVLESNREVYDPEFTINRLAELTDSKSKYVSQAINDIVGKDFRTLIADIRMREACRLLSEEAVNGRLTVAAIAAEVGYKSRTHFSKVFKEVTGMTPSEFLKQARRSQGLDV